MTHTCPFGPDHEVFKVVGKIFLMITEAPGEPIVTLKCEPPHAMALRQEFPTITPGYHMNKKHWNTLLLTGQLSSDEIQDLARHSYLLVSGG